MWKMASEEGAVGKLHGVMSELGLVLQGLVEHEDTGAEHGDGHVDAVPAELAQLQHGPSHDDRDGGGDEHDRVDEAERDIEVRHGPWIIGTNAEEDVGGEQAAEEHDFRSEEEPDADLGVVEAGVRPGVNGIRDVH